jgi:PAS domain S-box-containing protein
MKSASDMAKSIAALLNDKIDPSKHSLTLADFRRPDMPLIYVNQGFERMTGYTRQEAIGRNCRFLQGASTDSGAVVRMKRALVDEETVIFDLINYWKDRSQFWNRISLRPVVNGRGKATHFVGIQSDITRMRDVEQRLYEIARMLQEELSID